MFEAIELRCRDRRCAFEIVFSVNARDEAAALKLVEPELDKYRNGFRWGAFQVVCDKPRVVNVVSVRNTNSDTIYEIIVEAIFVGGVN